MIDDRNNTESTEIYMMDDGGWMMEESTESKESTESTKSTH